MDIKKGDVVRLKSGGPEMTVDNVFKAIGGQTMANCKWFAGLIVQEKAFDVNALELND